MQVAKALQQQQQQKQQRPSLRANASASASSDRAETGEGAIGSMEYPLWHTAHMLRSILLLQLSRC